jgi:hypothetical protein
MPDVRLHKSQTRMSRIRGSSDEQKNRFEKGLGCPVPTGPLMTLGIAMHRTIFELISLVIHHTHDACLKVLDRAVGGS